MGGAFLGFQAQFALRTGGTRLWPAGWLAGRGLNNPEERQLSIHSKVDPTTLPRCRVLVRSKSKLVGACFESMQEADAPFSHAVNPLTVCIDFEWQVVGKHSFTFHIYGECDDHRSIWSHDPWFSNPTPSFVGPRPKKRKKKKTPTTGYNFRLKTSTIALEPRSRGVIFPMHGPLKFQCNGACLSMHGRMLHTRKVLYRPRNEEQVHQRSKHASFS